MSIKITPERYICQGFSYQLINTFEGKRATKSITTTLEQSISDEVISYEWSLTSGIRPISNAASNIGLPTTRQMNNDGENINVTDTFTGENKIQTMFDYLLTLTSQNRIILLSMYIFDTFWSNQSGENPFIVSLLLDYKIKFKQAGVFILFVHPSATLPIRLQKEIVVNEFDFPSAEERKKILTSVKESIKQSCDVEFNDAKDDDIIEKLNGTTLEEAEDILALAFEEKDKAFSLPIIQEFKAQIIKKAVGLDLYEGVETLSNLGGFQGAKDFCVKILNRKRQDIPHKGVLLTSGPGCLHGDTPIYDPVDKTTKTVEERYKERKSFHVYSIGRNGITITSALTPHKYKPAKMVKLTLENQDELIVTLQHRFWNGYAWTTAANVHEEMQLSSFCHLASTLDTCLPNYQQDAAHLKQTTQDFPHDYQFLHHFYDERFHMNQGNAQDVFPLQVDAHAPYCGNFYKDDSDNTSKDNHFYLPAYRPSKPNFWNQHYHPVPNVSSEFFRQHAVLTLKHNHYKNENVLQFARSSSLFHKDGESNDNVAKSKYAVLKNEIYDNQRIRFDDLMEYCSLLKPSQRDVLMSQDDELFLIEKHNYGTAVLPLPHGQKSIWPLDNPQESTQPLTQHYTHFTNRITVIKSELLDNKLPYFDFHVPIYNNYWACGLWHHNCGKSHFAKGLGAETGLPVLMLDIGSLFGSHVGDSEKNTRMLISTINSFGKCIVVMDEIDKSLAGIAGAEGDSGVTKRVIGCLLTWLNDRKNNAFIVCTANNIHPLLRSMPELFRAGRFNRFFYCPFPNEAERNIIWNIYTTKYELDAKQERPNSNCWTGAEIKECCENAAMLDLSLKEAGNSIIPIYDTIRETMEKMEEWAESRTIDARTGKPFQRCNDLEKLMEETPDRKFSKKK